MDALDTTIFSQVNIEQPFMGLRMENLVRGTSPASGRGVRKRYDEAGERPVHSTEDTRDSLPREQTATQVET